ncbi:hypothetical protein H257_07051 [Aphanomyces astaci]|uniref:ATP-dependent DNA helicase n=1 Tax=Aphanomyces astaci TaxID=112090 RepID=W4GJF3_APHAT|nr:hypothetical protein H257_07051 [Aphanomyces astaci]ETV79835.1 hypothetical protein H257_07051 [Aphanomyces astaci]|eukprot:XP_009830771.1 hypothetical protein H257_07051 [Aphanomyces astaci]
MDPYVFPDSPEMQAFKDLFKQRNLIEHIRQYNAQFNFTSIGTDEVRYSGRGPNTYCIQRQLTHNIGPLQPSLNRSGNLRQPSFAQIYMHTSEEQLLHRRNMFPAISSRYTATVQRVMDLHNPLASAYATTKERLRRAEADGTSGGNLHIVLKAVGGAQARTHNLPTVAQLAVIMEGDGSEPTDGRHVRSLSLRAVFNYWLQERDGGDFSDMLHRSPMLLKMYTTVGFVLRMETNRLRYILQNGDKLRFDLYTRVKQAAERRSGLHNVGIKSIVPSSFTGGKRYMKKCYFNATAIVRKYGKPYLFVTMTCNPNWLEIISQLKPHQTSAERDDIVTCVFETKLTYFEDDIHKKHVLGKVVASVHVEETVEDINSVVFARIPDEIKNPQLHESAKNFMIHTCTHVQYDDNGQPIPSARACTHKTGKCKKGFPQPLQATTTERVDGYAKYRRDTAADQYCVPHSPYLVHKYNCHINVEICTSIKAVKYLYKYVYKGSDRIKYAVFTDQERQPMLDEAREYVEGRYVTSLEAITRTRCYDLQRMSHAVEVLPVHEKDQQHCTYDETHDAKSVVARNQKTKLISFFLACVQGLTGIDGRSCKELPNHIKVIGRIDSVSPRQKERFYIRTLLCHKYGPTSFEDLRTVHGTLYSTYEEAALSMGLLENDEVYVVCIRQATLDCMDGQLHELFANILVHCLPANTRALFDQFKSDFLDKQLRDLRRCNEALPQPLSDDMMLGKAMFYTLKSIDNCFQHHRMSLLDYPTLPQLHEFEVFGDLGERQLLNDLRSWLYVIETSYTRAALDDVLATAATMTDEHRSFVATVLAQTYDHASGKAYFLQGEGGSGKSYVSQILLAKVRDKGDIALAVASFGLVALLLMGGTTAHSRFKIPVTNLNDKSLCHIPKQSSLAKIIRDTKLIAVDRSLRDIMDNPTALFGDKVVVFSGDFKPILPIILRGTPSATVEASFRRSSIWNDVKIVKLAKNMRLRGGSDDGSIEEWAKTLVDIGNGTNWETDHDLNAYIDQIYGNINNPANPPENVGVDEYNAKVLRKMNSSAMFTCLSVDSVEQEGEDVDDTAMEFQVPEFHQHIRLATAQARVQVQLTTYVIGRPSYHHCQASGHLDHNEDSGDEDYGRCDDCDKSLNIPPTRKRQRTPKNEHGRDTRRTVETRSDLPDDDSHLLSTSGNRHVVDGASVPLPADYDPSDVRDDMDMGSVGGYGHTAPQVWNSPAIPQPPTFSISTKAERRAFMREYQK